LTKKRWWNARRSTTKDISPGNLHKIEGLLYLFTDYSFRIGKLKKNVLGKFDLTFRCEEPGDTLFQLLSLNGVASENDVIAKDGIFTVNSIADKNFIHSRPIPGQKYFTFPQLFHVLVEVGPLFNIAKK
jgi:hypothetical protein